jgi:hypothetical protein
MLGSEGVNEGVQMRVKQQAFDICEGVNIELNDMPSQ